MQTKITCDLSLPAPLAFALTSCTHQHTQALSSTESRQNGTSYVVAASKDQCFNGRKLQLSSLLWKTLLVTSSTMMANYLQYLQHQRALYLLH